MDIYTWAAARWLGINLEIAEKVMSLLTCHNCGAQWNSNTTPPMYHFKPHTSETVSGYTSPAQIDAAELYIMHCPKCPIPRLDEAMKTGDRRTDD